MRYEGKVVAITGAASGIGKATAERMAAEGARLVLGDINQERLDAVAAALAQSSPVTHVFDVGEPAACAQFISVAMSAYGQLDMLCNVAGVLDWSPLGDFDQDRWNRILAVNMGSVFFLSQAAAPHLGTTKGNIVNVSSAAGLVGIAYASAYCATKAGVVAMTKAMSIELATSGVRVNAVCPGGVATPMVLETALPSVPDMTLVARSASKLGWLIPPEEIADAIAYLGSESARSISGAALSIDGAQTAG